MQIIDKAKLKFLSNIDNFGSDPFRLKQHVVEAERWANFLLDKYLHVDKEIVLLSVWLHDIGHYPIIENSDHAITSEKISNIFLCEEKYSNNKLNNVLHCIRSHRCNDVKPQTIEAKIVACVDSASHMTDTIYLDIAKNNKRSNYNYNVLEKMERDYRDISVFPEVKEELEELYFYWKKLIFAYKKMNYK